MKIVFQSLSQTCLKTESSSTYSNNRASTCERKAANGMAFSLECCKHTFEQQAGCVSLPASAVHPLKNAILQSFRGPFTAALIALCAIGSGRYESLQRAPVCVQALCSCNATARGRHSADGAEVFTKLPVCV